MEDKNRKLSVCVLISCMYQDQKIIDRTRVQTDVVVVNQCDVDDITEWDFVCENGRKCHAKFISTKERGLSRSRNMALQNAISDICLICDDDEVLSDGYERLVQEGYEYFPQASVVTYKINREYENSRKYPPAPGMPHGLVSILKTNSLEITFKRKVILDKGIEFDELMGSGTGNGAGEEEKFLMDIRRSGLQLFFYSNTIATVHKGASQWFKGFDSEYFYNKGWSARRILGGPISIVYLLYFSVSHYKLFRAGITLSSMVRSLARGWVSKRSK